MVCTYNTCDEHSQHFQDFHARALNGHETIGFRKPESSANFTFLRSRSTSQRWAEHGAEANPAIPKRYVGAYDSLRFSDNVQRREVTPKSISSRIVLRSSLQHTRRIVRRRPHVRRREATLRMYLRPVPRLLGRARLRAQRSTRTAISKCRNTAFSFAYSPSTGRLGDTFRSQLHDRSL